jgi:iron complex transport system ATP-binding protein
LLQADNVSYVHGAKSSRAGTVSGRGARHERHSQDPGSRVALPGVQEVSLRLARGGVLGILGPNGSGKTTLLRLLAGLLSPTLGRVLIEGLDLASIPRRELAKRVAVVPQETHLAFEYSVLEIALMGRYPHLGAFEFEGPRDLAIAREALDATGTAHLAHRPFSTLSGGEKQRVIIASALAQEAEILLLDEPTASLDLGYQLDVAALLARLNRERGLTLVIATHDLNFAAGLCRTMLLLREGRVLADGLTADVLTAASIASLYGVRADVRFHQAAGHMTVVPLGRETGSAHTQR